MASKKEIEGLFPVTGKLREKAKASPEDRPVIAKMMGSNSYFLGFIQKDGVELDKTGVPKTQSLVLMSPGRIRHGVDSRLTVDSDGKSMVWEIYPS